MAYIFPLTEEEFKSIYSKVPRLCVDLFIQTEQGILLTLRKEKSWNSQWHIPGGTLYYKERLEDAVQRVAKGELGIEVSIEKLLGYIEYSSEEKERGFGYTVSVAFLCSPKSTEFKLNQQASEAKFFISLPANTIVEQKQFIEKYFDIE